MDSSNPILDGYEDALEYLTLVFVLFCFRTGWALVKQRWFSTRLRNAKPQARSEQFKRWARPGKGGTEPHFKLVIEQGKILIKRKYLKRVKHQRVIKGCRFLPSSPSL